jgi:hypothetical protein
MAILPPDRDYFVDNVNDTLKPNPWELERKTGLTLSEAYRKHLVEEFKRDAEWRSLNRNCRVSDRVTVDKIPAIEEPQMNTKTRNAAILMNDNIHTIRVRINKEDETGYIYLADRSWGIREGDKVWVTASTNKSHARPVEVMEVHDDAEIDIDSTITYKFCNGVAHNRQEQAEEALLDKIDEITKVRAKQVRDQLRADLKNGKVLEHLGN